MVTGLEWNMVGSDVTAREVEMKRSELIRYLNECGEGDPKIILRNDTNKTPTYYSVGSVEADERQVGPVIIIGYEK